MSFQEQMNALLAGSDVAPSEWLEYYKKMQPQVLVRATGPARCARNAAQSSLRALAHLPRVSLPPTHARSSAAF